MKSAGQSSLEHAFAYLVEGGDAVQAARDIAAVMSAM
jgi:hypothetical protein